MRLCVFGAGAIGAYVGARLLRSGADVSFVARGAHLAALRTRGLSVRDVSEEWHVEVRATDDTSSIGPVDVVLLAVKAHQIAPAIAQVRALYGPQTVVLAMQNGVPWWYAHGHPAASGWELQSVDPGGEIARSLEVSRAVGCIIYFSASCPAPGVVARASGRRLVLGEPTNVLSDRAARIAETLEAAGFDVPVAERLRPEIWSKLLGNVNFNPLSALTRASIREIYDDAGAMELVRDIMTEALEVARALGDAPAITIEERLAIAPRAGNVRTSMLQDVEAGRQLEIGPIVGAVVELGRLVGVPTPATRHVLALVSLLDRTLAASR